MCPRMGQEALSSQTPKQNSNHTMVSVSVLASSVCIPCHLLLEKKETHTIAKIAYLHLGARARLALCLLGFSAHLHQESRLNIAGNPGVGGRSLPFFWTAPQNLPKIKEKYIQPPPPPHKHILRSIGPLPDPPFPSPASRGALPQSLSAPLNKTIPRSQPGLVSSKNLRECMASKVHPLFGLERRCREHPMCSWGTGYGWGLSLQVSMLLLFSLTLTWASSAQAHFVPDACSSTQSQFPLHPKPSVLRVERRLPCNGTTLPVSLSCL